MNHLSAYLIGEENKEQVPAEVCVEAHGQIRAVYIDGHAPFVLHPDFGAGIDVTVSDVTQFMADFRYSEFWCMPAFGTRLGEVPDETQGLILRRESGDFAVVLPVVSEQYKCVLCGGADDTLTAKLFSWCKEMHDCHALAFLYAEGADPYALLEDCTRLAFDLLGTRYPLRADRPYPELFEYLGWCSWDAMEIRVNEADLLSKCREFRDKGIPVRWAILDDMWAEVHDFYGATYANRPEMFHLMHSSRLYSFRADPTRFPNGLDGCIKRMNDLGMRVGMWHPTTGYWCGLDPKGDAYDAMKKHLITTPQGYHIANYKSEDSYAFYTAFHDYLKFCGAEFVKIDNQTMTRRYYKGLAPVGVVAREFHDGMERAAREHFGANIINCMGMGSEDMWNRAYSPISRCSNDFLPDDSAWFTKHILQCAYNCLIQGNIHHCDWDMWWTDDPQGKKNSLLRAISGGPIYVSDRLGCSRADILAPLTLSDGRILRCDRPAVPTLDCLTVDPTASAGIFKLQNICAVEGTDPSGMVAVFDLDEKERPVHGTLSPSDVPGMIGEQFAVYEHFSGELILLNREERMEITLDGKDDFRLYVISPIKDGFAVIGRGDKFISPKTIEFVNGRSVKLYEAGECLTVEDGVLLRRRLD